ncbi:hypothetical protein CEXT_101211 [Caerostris extrusa]|uniref:Uncharacterized protein n=1 Tax=Caerostris extrusa TaxID=172846 RepID=A0AAV4U292_CAEEX|nr:hypothetical protein CEXT_101211 [Caerostris extrusa]
MEFFHYCAIPFDKYTGKNPWSRRKSDPRDVKRIFRKHARLGSGPIFVILIPSFLDTPGNGMPQRVGGGCCLPFT